ncbi:hypothetical protein DL95DRAFT_415434 [Leptodontidium sp. 2 PMI_412]|nr:hypothetical protein DL95DRAFT_415434 [Leptodontidium sp. 2 PMI_412]
MLPEHILETYTRYKDDTDAFATWLSNTARVCGYRGDNLVEEPANTKSAAFSGRLKGKARKEAKKKVTEPASNTTTKHRLPTRELLIQAELVASHNKPPVTVPLSIQIVLQRAITARKRCSTWFKNIVSATKTSEFQDSNATHEYFITVLERTFELLEPRFEPKKSTTRSDTQQSSSTPHTPQDQASELGNRFQGLEVDDISDHESENFGIKLPTKTTADPGNRSKAKTPNVFELELFVVDDMPFFVYCFFEDLHRTRKLILQIWEDFREGKLSALTASITTNIAMELVQKAEKEILNILGSEIGSHQHSYITITARICPVPDFRFSPPSFQDMRGMKQEKKKSPIICKPNQLDDFVFLHTFVSLQRTKVRLMINDVQTCMVSMEYVYLVQRLILPTNQKWAAEGDLLAKLLIDLHKKVWYDELLSKDIASPSADAPGKAGSIKHYPMYEDELTKLLQHVTDSLEISVSAVFGGRIILDILELLGDQSAKPYQMLCQAGANTSKVLGMEWENKGGVYKIQKKRGQTIQQMVDSWATTDTANAARDLSGRIMNVISTNGIFQTKHVAMLSYLILPSQLPVEDRDFVVVPSEDPAFYLANQPIYCGLETLKVLVDRSALGIDLANNSSALAPMAHLYNALLLKHIVKERWIEMDGFIARNMSVLFKGSLPQTNAQIYTRFLLCLGVPVHKFSQDLRQPVSVSGWKKVMKKSQTILQTSDLTTSLQKYLKGEVSGEKLLFSSGKAQHCARNSANRQLTQLELLARFKGHCQEAIPGLEADIISLTRKSGDLLQRIRSALKITHYLDLEHAENGEIHDMCRQCNIDLVFRLLLDTDQDKMLEDVGEVVNGFLPEANPIIDVAPLDPVAETRI